MQHKKDSTENDEDEDIFVQALKRTKNHIPELQQKCGRPSAVDDETLEKMKEDRTAGMSYPEIADKYGLHRNTVSKYLRGIMPRRSTVVESGPISTETALEHKAKGRFFDESGAEVSITMKDIVRHRYEIGNAAEQFWKNRDIHSDHFDLTIDALGFYVTFRDKVDYLEKQNRKLKFLLKQILPLAGKKAIIRDQLETDKLLAVLEFFTESFKAETSK